MFRPLFTSVFASVLLMTAALSAARAQAPQSWESEWPRTDFESRAVDLASIRSGGPPKDGIPSIDNPRSVPVPEADHVSAKEPVISVTVDGSARAYPLAILMWHEIVNDGLGGTPIAVTYCPLCNAALVFERTVRGRVVTFGTTGKLRHSDLVMYDRQTESWWQQFTGKAIVGDLKGTELVTVPSRVEPFSAFKERHPRGSVLAPPRDNQRPYGRNPYAGYDSADWPFLYDGSYDGPVPPLSYVVAVGEDAWPLSDVRREGRIVHGDLVVEWQSGMRSALDASSVSDGRDIGSVEVTRNGEPVTFHTPFAFAFAAFEPDGVIHSP